MYWVLTHEILRRGFNMSELDKIIQDRLEKLKKLQELGVDPYSLDSFQATPIKDARNLYKEGENSPEVAVAGRITALRGHGKVFFFDIRDWTGKIQGYGRSDVLGEDF